MASHESAIAALLEKPDEAAWRLPMLLTGRLPFAAFMATVQKAPVSGAREVLVQCALPLPAPTEKEQARYRLRAEVPRFALHISESAWCNAMAWAGLFGLTLTADEALALLIGERLANLSAESAPHGRPFAVEWMKAIEQLAAVTMQVHWQAKALQADRGIVHKVSKAIRSDARQLPAGWGSAGREGIVT